MTAGPGGEGLFVALKTLFTTLLGIGKTRLELLSVELQEEKFRLLGLFVYSLAALFFLGLGIVLAVAWVAVAFWEQRVVVFAAFTVLFLVVAAILASLASKAANRGSPIFRSSLAELQADLIELQTAAKKPAEK